MKLKNTTSVPDTLLREVVRFACPSSVTNFSIWFKRFRSGTGQVSFCGRAYESRDHVSCRIPPFERLTKPYLPTGIKRKGGYLPWNACTYEEALVALVAHELNHLAQYRNPKLYRRTWGARGQTSERDCDTYAIRKLREWRALHDGTKAPGPKPPRKGPKPLTPRQRLEAMADPHGIQLDFGSPSPDCIWVYPPERLLDEHGEMPGDPYLDGHTFFSYAEAKEAIEAYVRLCLTCPVTPATVES